MRKYVVISVLCISACDGGPPPDSAHRATTQSTTALYETASSIAALKALLPATRAANTLYYVQGYYADGDGGNGLLEWRPSSLATPDDILVFLPDDLTTASPGRYHQVIDNGSFDAKRGGLSSLYYDASDVCMATTACVSGDACCPNGCQSAMPADTDCKIQGVKLQSIYRAVNSAQIGELYIPSGRYDVRDSVALGAATAGAHTSIRGAGTSETTLYGGQAYADDPTHPGAIEFTSGLSGHTSWIQALAAGDTVLHATGLYMPFPGEPIYLELGADNTDQTAPYLVMMTKVLAVSGTDLTIADPIPETIPPYTNDVLAANQNFISVVGNPVEGVNISNLSTDLLEIVFDKAVNVSMHDCTVKRSTSTFTYANVWNLSLYNITADHIFGYGSGWYGWFLSGWKAYGLRASNINISYLEGVPLFVAESQSRDVTLEHLHVYSDTGRAPTNEGLISGGHQSSGTSWPPSGSELTHASDTIEVADFHLDLGPGTSSMGDSVRFDNLEITGGSPSAPPNFNVHLSDVYGDFKWEGQFFNQRIPFSTYIPLSSGPGTTDYSLPVTGLVGKMRTYVSTLTDVTFVGVGYTGTGWVESNQSELVAGQWVDNQIPTATASGYANNQIGTKFVRVTTSAALPAAAYMIVEGESLTSDQTLATRPSTTKAGSGAPTVTADYIGQRYFDYTNARFYTAVRTGGGSTDWVLQ